MCMTRDANVDFLKIQDGYLQEKLNVKGIIDITVLKLIEKNIILWKGDIATLKCGTIVNCCECTDVRAWFFRHGSKALHFISFPPLFRRKTVEICHKYQ